MAAVLLSLLLLAGCASFRPRVARVWVGGEILTLYEAHEAEINRLCREKGGFSYEVAGCWIPGERAIYCSLGAEGCLEHELCHAKGRDPKVCDRLTYVDWREYVWR